MDKFFQEESERNKFELDNYSITFLKTQYYCVLIFFYQYMWYLYLIFIIIIKRILRKM